CGVTSETDGEGNQTFFHYLTGGHGLLERKTSPRGHDTTYSGHDDFGHPRVALDPAGIRTTSDYDGRGRLGLVSDSLGHRSNRVYDGLDRVKEQIRFAGGGPSGDEHTLTSYYPGGQVHTTTNANQSLT